MTASASGKVTPFLNGAAFVSLNLADAWLTKQYVAAGGGEANPIVGWYGHDLWTKGLVALAVVLILAVYGKPRLLKVLNVCMAAVVLWTGGWLLTY